MTFIRTCAVCGSQFLAGAFNAKYCSRECRLEKRRRQSKARKNLQPPKLYDKTCPVCGKDFKAKYRHRVYCSKPCYYRSRNLGLRDIPRDRGKKDILIQGLCSICGAEEVAVWACNNCGFLVCKNCLDNQGLCKICSDKADN